MTISKTTFFTVVFIVINLMIVTGCASNQNKTSITICKEPRPQICTQDYSPVCAKLKSGDYRTYSNGCTSCSDTNVVGYIDKACLDPG